jgi:hypothetical protein
MNLTVHAIDAVPGPQDTRWVDAVLSTLRPRAGALVAGPLGIGPGALIAFWTGAPDPAGFAAGDVTVGAGSRYEIDAHRAGLSAGPARFLQLTTFTGRGAEWCAAFDRTGQERMWPAVKDLPGLVGVVTCGTPDGDRLVLTLADSVEALEAGAAAILSSELLPWEDPAHLTGPDALAVLRLRHADVPATATR